MYVDNLNFDNLITGISEISSINSISVYPNPFFSTTTLKSENVLKDATLVIYNSLGLQVKEIKNINGQTITLQRDNLPKGLYFICLMQDNITLTTEKLILED